MRVSNSLDPDQDRLSLGSDLGPNCCRRKKSSQVGYTRHLVLLVIYSFLLSHYLTKSDLRTEIITLQVVSLSKQDYNFFETFCFSEFVCLFFFLFIYNSNFKVTVMSVLWPHDWGIECHLVRGIM